MDSTRKKKKGELLAAFDEGDIVKILQLAKNIPHHAIITIPLIVQEWKKSASRISPLTAAVVSRNYHLCELLVEDGVSLSDNFEKLHPLSLALYHKQSEIAELLLRSGADVNRLENDGASYPLFWAIHENSPPHVVEQIILAGFPVNALVRRDVEMTAIQCAALDNNMEAAEVLRKYSVDLNVVSSTGESALTMAIRYNFINMVKFLVKEGASLDNKSTSMCPLFLAIRFEHIRMVEVLLDLGADIQEGWVSKEIVPPLQFALSYLNIDIVLLLIARGANVLAKNISSNETALHVVATYFGLKYKGDILREIQFKITKALISKGVDVNAKDCYSRTPLDGAIFSENTELCKLLIREGAEVTGTGWIRGDGILSNRFEYICCVGAFKCPELIKVCLERGGDYNYRDRHGLSPYHCALAKHNPEMVKVFWQHGCPFDQPEHIPGKMKEMLWYNPDAADKKILSMQTDFMDGIKNNNLELVISLLKRGAEPKGCSMKIPSTLHYIAASGNYKLARVLLERGVPVNSINKKGKTPLHLAAEKKNFQTCLVFLQFGACYNYRSTTTDKTMKLVVKENEQLHELFINIYKCFRWVKQGNDKVLTLLQEFVTSGDIDVLHALMNCINRKGQTLVVMALNLGNVVMGRKLMAIRLENM